MADGTKFPSIDYRKCEPWLKQQQKTKPAGEEEKQNPLFAQAHSCVQKLLDRTDFFIDGLASNVPRTSRH
jgi:hypothetical protein